MGASDALAQARAVLAHANNFERQVNAVAPPASLTPGAGHGVGMAFAQAHGNDHTGAAPAPQNFIQDSGQGIGDKMNNINEYMSAQRN